MQFLIAGNSISNLTVHNQSATCTKFASKLQDTGTKCAQRTIALDEYKPFNIFLFL